MNDTAINPASSCHGNGLAAFLEAVTRRSMQSAEQSVDTGGGVGLVLCALVDTLVIFTGMPLTLMWVSRAGHQVVETNASEAAHVVQAVDVAELEHGGAGEALPSNEPLVVLTQHGADTLCLRCARYDERLWLTGPGIVALAEAGQGWLGTGLGTLYLTVQALLLSQRASGEHLLSLQHNAHWLMAARSASPRSDLRKASALLLELSRVSGACIDQIDALTSFSLQQALRTEWRGSAGTDRDLAGLEAAIDTVIADCPSAGRAWPLSRIRCSRHCLHALRAPADPVPDEHSETPLRLLPVWTQVHANASRPPSGWRRAEYDAEWREAVARTLLHLPAYLEVRATQLRKGLADTEQVTAIPSVRNRLCLWFCVVIMRSWVSNEKVLSEEERIPLAYVLRESLRFLCFRPAQDFSFEFEPRRYGEALSTLVAAHATRIIGLPAAADVGGLLEQLGREVGSRYAGAAHLQHVLETYIAGHFLLAIHLGQEPGAQTLAQLLAATDDYDGNRLDEDGLRRTFSLAVLFHDIDYLFMPPRARAARELASQHRSLEGQLDKLGRAMGADGVSLIDGWIAFLEDPARSGPGVYVSGDPRDATLRRWLDGQRKELKASAKVPKHGLMAAWLMHYLCQPSAEELPDAELERLLPSAVRAVLLHDAMTVEVDMRRDPVACLLIVVNEIFDWDPEQQRQPSTIGHSLHVLATEMPAPEPVYQSIEIESLQMIGDEALGVRPVLPTTTDVRWLKIRMRAHQSIEQTPLGVISLWLHKAQNLGRISATSQTWWPTVVMTSRVPRRDLSNRQILKAVLSDLHLSYAGGPLRQWLANAEIEQDGLMETATLCRIPQVALHQQPIPFERIVELGQRELERLLAKQPAEDEVATTEPASEALSPLRSVSARINASASLAAVPAATVAPVRVSYLCDRADEEMLKELRAQLYDAKHHGLVTDEDYVLSQLAGAGLRTATEAAIRQAQVIVWLVSVDSLISQDEWVELAKKLGTPIIRVVLRPVFELTPRISGPDRIPATGSVEDHQARVDRDKDWVAVVRAIMAQVERIIPDVDPLTRRTPAQQVA